MSEVDFESRVARALRAPVRARASATAAIMTRVRESAHSHAPRRNTTSTAPHGARHAIIGLAMAAGIGSISTLSVLAPGRSTATTGVVTSMVIGDTVSNALHDTLRLVRLIFDDPAASRVAMVGDFNGWRVGVTPMRRSADGRWTVTVALKDGAHRYAIVADDTRWAAESTDVRGRAWSTLRVAPTAN